MRPIFLFSKDLLNLNRKRSYRVEVVTRPFLLVVILHKSHILTSSVEREEQYLVNHIHLTG